MKWNEMNESFDENGQKIDRHPVFFLKKNQPEFLRVRASKETGDFAQFLRFNGQVMAL